ncbi:MAG: hypothetical protein HYS24_01515 [Ignavibacteriales bacterium]|nr:hypothetical protein [Ignavibacteriales bacterium]
MSNNNLYFIPILINAMEKENQIETIKKAIIEIQNLGKQNSYKEGYAQFNQFLLSGYNQNKNIIESDLRDLIVKIVTNEIELSETDRETILNKIKTEYKFEYEKIFEAFKNKDAIEIEIYKDGQLFNQITIDEKIKVYNITNIEPGDYDIKLSNGRILLQEQLTNDELVLDFKGNKFKYNLAAETDEIEQKPSLVFELIKDEIKLEVYAGLEYGKIKIRTE